MQRKLIGIAWLSPYDRVIPDYRLFKIFVTENGGYVTEQVAKADLVREDGQAVYSERVAWNWIRDTCPWPWVGVYYNGHPGLWWGKTTRVTDKKGHLVDVVDFQIVRDAVRVAARCGSLPIPEIVSNEAVAYTPWLPGEHKRRAHHDVDRRHPHIVPCRTRGQYSYLRRRYNVPDGWAMDYLPQSVIAARWGRRKSYEQQYKEAMSNVGR